MDKVAEFIAYTSENWFTGIEILKKLMLEIYENVISWLINLLN